MHTKQISSATELHDMKVPINCGDSFREDITSMNFSNSTFKPYRPLVSNILYEARQWVLNLKPSGGCNLLKALKKALTVICPNTWQDQASEILSEYIQECTVGRKLLVHTVTYDCSNQVPTVSLSGEGSVALGQCVCFESRRSQVQPLVGLSLVKRTRQVQLMMGDTLFNVMKQGSMECLKLPSETSLPKPPKHDCPLAIQIPSFSAQTSAEWLKTNGLKARKLSLYQVLAPNAFSPVEEFVPVLQKMVSSTLHEKAMTQFEWHDGTIKNIHVDPPILYDYQKRLGRLVRMYERRVDWLSTASRRIWGTVCEKRIVILIDVSKTNAMYIIHIQHSLRLLLEEQMSSKDFFNIICFGDTWAFKKKIKKLFNSSSSWVLTLQCEGTRNLMTALRRAVEIDFKDKDKHKSQSIYLLTTGVPDQEKHAICSYLAEVCGGCDLKLHVCLFSVDGFSLHDIPPRYASLNETAAICKEMAQTANGRFHCYYFVLLSLKKWLSRFSIKKLKLDLPSLVFGPECVHQKEMVASLHKQVSAKYCDIFPSVEIHGIVKHLQIQPKDLEVYIEQMERVLRCYVRRVQWLLSGSRRLFGVVLEANVCILIDTSGSMDRSLQEVTKELTSLIWEQLRKNNVKFSLISFAEDVDVWQECLVEATNETCHDAVQWLSTFHAHGNTSILKALRRAFSLPDVEALYVLTDGKPDTSCSLVLKEIEMLLKKRAIIIHTISFNCSDRAANDFLKKLAFQTGGRYHRCHGDVDGQMAAHRLLSEGFKDEDDPAFPLFEGDDLKKLVDEIAKARSYLTQAKFFKSLLEKKNINQKDRCP
uniref:von Willebrand factor A domain containing 3A n=1 Tax=Podarcis muralis TaxID=64176 RepID=A0A670KIP8_PODMU